MRHMISCVWRNNRVVTLISAARCFIFFFQGAACLFKTFRKSAYSRDLFWVIRFYCSIAMVNNSRSATRAVEISVTSLSESKSSMLEFSLCGTETQWIQWLQGIWWITDFRHSVSSQQWWTKCVSWQQLMVFPLWWQQKGKNNWLFAVANLRLITDRVLSTREGYVLSRVCPSVCLSTGGTPLGRGGVPQPGPDRGLALDGGVLPSNLGQGGPPSLGGGTIPGQDGGTPLSKAGWGYPLIQGWMGYPLAGMGYPPYRTTDGVLDTPWSVCLLRSRRRTSLFTLW